MNRLRLRYLWLSLPLAVLLVMACSSDETGTGPGGSGASGANNGTGAGGATLGPGGGLNFDGGGLSSSGGADACAQSTSQATLEQKPVDIIFIIGNNGSLSQEIDAVEKNINDNFAQIIGQSGIDYRVILLSRSGSHQFNICVEAPLGGVAAGQCALQDNNAAPVNNPPRFYHYSIEIKATDSWCKLLNGFDGTLADEYGQQPAGWSAWLRPEAAKLFVEISDSRINCLYGTTDLDEGPSSPNPSDIPVGEQAASDFDSLLLGLSPTHFGDVSNRNYIWYTIAGLEAKDAQNPTDPWLPTDPITVVKCTGDASPVSPAIGYQALSVLTGGLRFPICEWTHFDVIFQILAQGVIAGATVKCEFDIPDPPVGETLDLDTVVVQYTPGGSGTPEIFYQVSGLSECAADRFYIEDDKIKLCPEACTEVQADPAAKIDVLYGCEVDRPVPT